MNNIGSLGVQVHEGSEGGSAHLFLLLHLLAWESLQVLLMMDWHEFSSFWEMPSRCPPGSIGVLAKSRPFSFRFDRANCHVETQN